MPRLTDLTKTLTSPADGDLQHIVDISDLTDGSAGTSKKIALSNLFGGSYSSNLTLNGLTLNDLSASRLVATDGSKVLGSANLSDWIAGTSNQIAIADDGDGTVTLSTPQDIAAASSPTFAGLTLSGLTEGSVIFVGSSGLITEDNSNFFWDDATNRLSIGSLSYSDMPLNIIGSTSSTLQVLSTGASGATSGGGLYLYSDDGSTMSGSDRLGIVSFGGNNGSSLISASTITSFSSGTWTAGTYSSDLRFETTNGAIRSSKFEINSAGIVYVTANDLQVLGGNIVVSGTVDGRDVAADGTKLDTIETGADVTDATNVAAAGAIMDSDFSSNGVMIRTASGSYTSRTITGTSNEIDISDGDGVSGNPILSISTSYIGQTSITTVGTVSTGTWEGTTIAVDQGGTGQTSYTDGQLLIGNTTGNTLTKTTLTAGIVTGKLSPLL